MNKAELVSQLARATGYPKVRCMRGLNAALEIISQAIADGDTVKLMDFGSFYVAERAGYTGRHPSTGEPFDIPPKRIVGFRTSDRLKQEVNKHDNV